MWHVEITDDNKAEFMRFVFSQVPVDSVWVVGLWLGEGAAIVEKELSPFVMPSPKGPWHRLWDLLSGTSDAIYVVLSESTKEALSDILDCNIWTQILIQHVYKGTWRDDNSYWLVSYDFLDDTVLSKRVSETVMAEGARKHGFTFRASGD